jgi:hypothetical protein
MLKLKVIACDVLNREISFLSSQSECFVDVTFLHQGLHDTPEKLNTTLQAEIDRANKGFPYNYYGANPDFDFIVIGYGLCSNGIVGVKSDRIPMVIPRGHDCITLLLGSKDRYQQYFDKNPGTYWFTSGWIERSWQPCEEKHKAIYKEYLEKYGEENADFLLEMEQGWMKDYKNAAYIDWNCLPKSDFYRSFTSESADYLDWAFSELKGDSSLLKNIINGTFDENEVLIVPPGKKVIQSFDESIIKFE